MNTYTLNYKTDRLEQQVRNLYCYVKNHQGEGGGITVETDPTVPAHVKAITQADITKWNQGGTFVETDPTVPNHVKSITQTDINNWNTGASFVETDPIFKASPAYGITSQKMTSWDNKLSAETDTLESVVNRGNYTSKAIKTGSTVSPFYFGVHNTSKGMYFVNYDYSLSTTTGNSNIAFGSFPLRELTTGNYNTIFGYYGGDKITTGSNNTAIGGASSYVLSTGSDNTTVGALAGLSLTTNGSNTLIGKDSGYRIQGFKNTFIGVGTGYHSTTSNMNTIIGYKAGLGGLLGDRNIIIGAGAGQNVTGTNNVLIGSGVLALGGNVDNKFVLHSNHTVRDYTNTSEGIIATPQLSTLDNALMSGDFAAKTLSFNATLTLKGGAIFTGLTNAQGDVMFTKQVVAKPDGTLGTDERQLFIRANSEAEALSLSLANPNNFYYY